MGRVNFVREQYVPDNCRTLNMAILEAIAAVQNEPVTHLDSQLHEDIDTEALDDLFHHGASENMFVQFTSDGVHVRLWMEENSETVTIEAADDPFDQ